MLWLISAATIFLTKIWDFLCVKSRKASYTDILGWFFFWLNMLIFSDCVTTLLLFKNINFLSFGILQRCLHFATFLVKLFCICIYL